ncbi:diacylglycerol kinase family enzyme, partial [Streptococcus rupicaprae]
QTFGEWTTDKADYAAQPSPTVDKYTTDTPEVAPAPTSPEDSDSEVTVVYTPTSSETTETKTITRTIKYVDEAGNELAPAVTQTVTYTRAVTTNDATGEQTFGEWTSVDDSFDEVTSPTVPNRVTDTPVVASEVVTADASDKEVVVVYTPTSSETTETKTITRTIKYVDEAGNELAPAVTQTVTYTRTVTTNDVTGEQTFGEWTTDKADYAAQPSPTVDKYTTDTPEVASAPTSPEDSDSEVTVVYTPTSSETTETKTITRTIKYVDEAGNELAPAVTQTVTYTRAVTTNDATGEQTFGEWTSVDDSFDEVTSPTVPNRVTDTPVVASEVVTADASDKEVVVVYTPTSSETTETKTITRTIKYVDEAGNELAPAVTQTVTYTRTVTTNDATGEQTFGEWTSVDDSFDEVTSPTVPNRVTDTPVVASEVVTADASDKEVVVVYTPTSSETTETKTITRTIKYVDEAGNELAPAVTQTVTYTRAVTTNDATGEQTLGEWTSVDDSFDEVSSPTVPNRVTDTPVVASEVVTADASDKEVVVVYT